MDSPSSAPGRTDGNDDRISLVALIISLLALGAATGQLFQALFSTAEGYLRCQESVIGPWAGFTRRHWWWWSFRFETKFTTPIIRIESLGEIPPNSSVKGYVKNRLIRQYALRIPEDEYIKPSRAARYFGFSSTLTRGRYYPLELARTLDPKFKLNSNVSGSQDSTSNFQTFKNIIRIYLLKARHTVGRGQIKEPSESDSDEADPNGDLDQVSWLELLRSLHAYESPIMDIQAIRDHQRPTQDPTEIFGVVSRFTVQLVERSWSLLPSEVIKPFAQTTIGSILTIAHRLRMQWRQFRPIEGILYAESSAHSLYSPGILRGLGILVEYKTTVPYSFQGYAIIPSVEVKKLSFGAITIQDRHSMSSYNICNNETGEFQPKLVFWLLNNLSILDEAFIETLMGDEDDEVHSSSYLVIDMALFLLLNFLPIPNCTASRITWPYQSRQLGFAVMLAPEGRATLMHRLGVLITDTGAQSSLSLDFQGLKEISDKLRWFHKTFNRNFYSFGFNIEGILDGELTAPEMLNLLEYLRKEVRWCDNPYGEDLKDARERHFLYSSFVIKDIYQASKQAFDKYHGKFRDNRWFDDLQKPDSWTRGGREFPMELAHQLVDQAHERWEPVSLENIVHLEHWWRLMYRGIMWSVALQIDNLVHTSVSIPTGYLRSEMPVYIA